MLNYCYFFNETLAFEFELLYIRSWICYKQTFLKVKLKPIIPPTSQATKQFLGKLSHFWKNNTGNVSFGWFLQATSYNYDCSFTKCMTLSKWWRSLFLIMWPTHKQANSTFYGQTWRALFNNLLLMSVMLKIYINLS